MDVFGVTAKISGRPCAACLNYVNETPGCLRTDDNRFVHMVAPGVYVLANPKALCDGCSVALPPGRKDLCATCQAGWEQRSTNARHT